MIAVFVSSEQRQTTGKELPNSASESNSPTSPTLPTLPRLDFTRADEENTHTRARAWKKAAAQRWGGWGRLGKVIAMRNKVTEETLSVTSPNRRSTCKPGAPTPQRRNAPTPQPARNRAGLARGFPLAGGTEPCRDPVEGATKPRLTRSRTNGILSPDSLAAMQSIRLLAFRPVGAVSTKHFCAACHRRLTRSTVGAPVTHCDRLQQNSLTEQKHRCIL
jgi:hypothetical protein